MDNNEIIRRYEKLVSKIEKSDIYDGRWTYDLYKCESCGKEMVTTYADKGVTPFMIGCQCGGMMSHCKTFYFVPDYIPVYEWRRPTLNELYNMSENEIDHVLNGGLILDRDIPKNGNEDKKIKRPDIIERYIPPLTRRERRKLERDKKRGKGIH